MTIGIIDAYASPTVLADANTYAARHGDPGFAPGQFSQSNAARIDQLESCDASGWYGEETLDVEAAHGMAPAANVRYYGARNCYDDALYDAVTRTVDENRVDVVSNSYGMLDEAESAGNLALGKQMYQQAALQGITYLFSSGDDSRRGREHRVPPDRLPRLQPLRDRGRWDLDRDRPDRRTEWQTGWGTRQAKLWRRTAGRGTRRPTPTAAVAGTRAVPEPELPERRGAALGEGGGRAVPDVALDADPTTGMLIGETQRSARGRATASTASAARASRHR